jgi:hypothetical protein
VRFGDSEMSPKLYGGDYEQDVPATYHHAGHSRRYARDIMRYAQAVNQRDGETYGDSFFARAPIMASFHDSIMGNGRGHDERQSARLASEVILACYYATQDDGRDDLVEAGIDATKWDEQLQAQAVRPGQRYIDYRRANAVADLLPVFEPNGPYQGVCLFVEDHSKQVQGQIFQAEAAKQQFEVAGASVVQCLEVVEESTVLRGLFRQYLGGQAGFYRTFKPADPSLDELFPGRQDNIDYMQHLAGEYEAGVLNAPEVLEDARRFAA